ncbi:MAG: hypothetical protein JSR41_15210 [Proteobacteria bacterium]|nr:hypothetical protein [Pseudomonadota bacterium]
MTPLPRLIALGITAVALTACGKNGNDAAPPAATPPAAASPGASSSAPHPSEPTGAGAAVQPVTPAPAPGSGEGAPASSDPAGHSKKAQ